MPKKFIAEKLYVSSSEYNKGTVSTDCRSFDIMIDEDFLNFDFGDVGFLTIGDLKFKRSLGEEVKPGDKFNFGEALSLLKDGRSLRRRSWDKSLVIALQDVDDGSFMTLPYIFIFLSLEKRVPWTPTYADLLANDWEVIK